MQRGGLPIRLFVAIALLVAVGAQCPCGDKAPNDDFTCAEQAEFGQCEKDWMRNGGFCACTCGRCEEKEEEVPVLELEDDIPVKPNVKVAKKPAKKPKKSPATKRTRKAEKEIEDEVDPKDSIEVEIEPKEAQVLPEADLENLEPLSELGDKACKSNVAEVIAGASELTILSSLLKATELVEPLSSKTLNVTIFAPSDEAFEGLGVEPSELAANLNEVATLLEYHVVPDILTTSDIAKTSIFETLAEDLTLFGGSSKEIEGLGSSGRIIGKPVPVCDSVIYLIDEVLLPAATLEEVLEPKDLVEDQTDQEDESNKKAECKKDYDAFFAISSDEDLSMFAEAMNTAQLSGDIADADNIYTILAPTNTAIKAGLKKLKITWEDFLEDTDTLTGILNYHIIEKNIEASLFEEGPIKTLNGTTIFVEVDKKVEFAGKGTSAKAIETDIDLACDSAVHKIDMVLLPFKISTASVVKSTSSRGKSTTVTKTSKTAAKKTCQAGPFSLYQVITRNPQLKVFSQVIQSAKMISLLNDKDTKVTVFAPVDYAFGNLLPRGKGFFDLVPDTAIAEALVSYHIAGAPVLSRYFRDGLEARTMLASSKGKPLNLEIVDELTSPTKLAIKGAASEANIIKTDIIGCNSVIHLVDSVLLPSPKIVPGKKVPRRTAITTAQSFQSLLKADVENKASDGS